jgi:transcriptional regulator GlxA family with amidase domain
MEANIEETLAAEELAARVGVSRRQLERQFSETGVASAKELIPAHPYN